MENPKKKKQKKLNTLSNYNNSSKDMKLSILEYIDFKDLFNMRNTNNENKKLIDGNFKFLVNGKKKYFDNNYIQYKIKIKLENKLENNCEKPIEINFCNNKNIKKGKDRIWVDVNKIIVISSNKKIGKYFMLYNGYMHSGNILGIVRVFREKNKMVNFYKQKEYCMLYNGIFTAIG